MKTIVLLCGVTLASSLAFAESVPNEPVATAAQTQVQSGVTDISKLLKTEPISQVESSIEVKGNKLPMVTQLSGSQPGLPADLHTKSLYVEFQGSPLLTAFLREELTKKGYQFVEEKTQATYVIVGSGVYKTKMTGAGYARFGGQVAALVEKSHGIDKIDVDQFPECVGQTPDAAVHVDLGAAQSVANSNIAHGSSVAGGVAGGIAVAAGVDYIGEKTGLRKAVNGGFLRMIGGGNLGLDDPMCLFDCNKTQTLTINLVVAEHGQPINLLAIETVLKGTKKHMPNEELAENLKNGLTLF